MAKPNLFLTGIILSTPLLAQTTFANTYASTGTQTQGYALQQSSDGGYIVAGISTTTATRAESAWVLKLDASGAVTWQNLYGGTGISGQLVAVKQTSDSGYILAGNTNNSTAWVMKLDSGGGMTWSGVFNSSAGYTYFYSIQQTPDGGYIAAGRNGTEAWLVKLDSSGNSSWQLTYNPYNAGAFGQFYEVTLTSDGGYAAAGNLANGSFVVKTDSNGNPQWQNLYADFYGTSGNSIRQTSDGGYIVGASFEFGNESTTYNRAAVMKLDSTGSVTWQQTFSLTRLEADTSSLPDDGDVSAAIVSVVRQTASGGYVFLTSRSLTNSTYTSIVAGLDANGGVLWQNGFRTGVAGTYATSIETTSDGGYAVTGVTSLGSDQAGLMVLKLNQFGQVPLCAAINAPSGLLETGISSTVTPESEGVQSAAATAGALAVSVTATTVPANNLCH